MSISLATSRDEVTHTNLYNPEEILNYCIFTLYVPNLYNSETHYERCITTTLKIALSTISSVACLVFIAPASKASNNEVLKVLFSSGEVITWGTLFSWSCINVVDRIAEDMKIGKIFPDKKKSILNKIYWLVISILGLSSKLPSVYKIYFYSNGSWTSFAPLIHASLPTFSLDAMIQKIVHTNNWFTRCLHRSNHRTFIFKAKENFCALIEECLTDLLDTQNPYRSKIFSILSENIIDFESRELFLRFFQQIVKNKIEKLRNEKIWLKRGNLCFQITGCLLALCREFLDGFLVYKGSQIILDNKFFISFIVCLAIIPHSYIDLEINRRMYDQIFQKAVTSFSNFDFCISSFSSSYIYKIVSHLKYFPAIFLSIFGIGSTIAVLRDNFGFEEEGEKFFAIATCGSTITLLSYSMIIFTDFINQKFQKHSNDEQLFIKYAKNVKSFLSFIKKMPDEVFESFIINFEKTNKENFLAFLADEDFASLVEKIDTLLLDRELKEIVGS